MSNISCKKYDEHEIDLFGPTGEFIGSLIKLDTGKYAYKAVSVFMTEDTLRNIVEKMEEVNVNVTNSLAALLKNR